MSTLERTRLTPAEARSLAADAYIFGYPLMLLDATCRAMTSVPAPAGGKAPVNQFAHYRAFPDASFTKVVSPNVDTLYSVAFLDLSDDPIVLSVPDTAGRYYLLPILDAWTNVFAAPGARTTGTGPGNFALVGPTWRGSLPTDVQEIRAPTDLAWAIGRTQTNGRADLPAVHAVQDGYRLTPLSAWGTTYTPPTSVPVVAEVDQTPPPAQVERMTAGEFLGRLAALMDGNPPTAADAPMVARLAMLGVVPGMSFDESTLDPALAAAIEQGFADAHENIHQTAQAANAHGGVNGWRMSLGNGTYGTDYLRRAFIAFGGLGANLTADAVYPSTSADINGEPLTGQRRYRLHFTPEQLPPVNAFWSLTMYKDHHYFVDNPLNRYAIGDRDPLQYNPDGSLDLHLQQASPGPDRESNWLPAPEGAFIVVLRMYWPKQAVLDGDWQPPSIQPVD